MNNIYEVSSRTRCKILKRMIQSCSNCGWNKSSCDLHHIIPRSRGGSNDHTNLTILCPNCHRLAHENKITSFVSLQEQIGDSWKQHYARTNIGSVEIAKKGNLASLDVRRKMAIEKASTRIEEIKNSGIDFSKRGWVQKVSEKFGMKHQHVSRYIKMYNHTFYEMCYKRGR